MRTLRDFLLAEAKEEENKDNKGKDNKTSKPEAEYPEGFKVVDLRGGLTDLAKEAMGAKNFTAAMDLAATKNPDKIKQEFGTVNGTSHYEILKSVVGNKNKFNQVFQKKVSPLPGHEGGIILYFVSNDWTTLAGKSESSKRLVRFWLQSLLLAYGVKKPSKLTYLSNVDNDLFAVH